MKTEMSFIVVLKMTIFKKAMIVLTFKSLNIYDC